MQRQSHIDNRVILRTFRRVLSHPWIWSRLVGVEGQKLLFNLRRANGCDGRAGRIRQLGIRITDMCNMRCRTCGQWGEQGFLHTADLKRLKSKEVPPSRYQALFADLVDHGHFPVVYFWGGEPMLYDGILDLIERATALKLPVSIATNGTGMAAAARRLVAAPLFLLQVSIDGHNARLHNRLRPSVGGGDGFARLCRGLDRVRLERRQQSSTLPVIASLTVISEDNADHLVELYKAFADRVDLFVFYLSWWIDETDAHRHEEDFNRRFGFVPRTHRGWLGSWRPASFHRLDRQLAELRRLSRRKASPPVTLIPAISGAERLEAYYTDHRARFGYDQCVSIYQAAEVNSNGDLSPCRDYHDFVVGNVRDETLTQLWNSPGYRQFRRSLHTQGLMPVCSRCCGLMGY